MTVPAAPLPSVGNLLRAIRTPFDFRNPLWADEPRRLYLFGSGRAALAAGVEAHRTAQGADRVRVWWPGYICVEALAGLQGLPVSFEFYRICPDLTPDWDALGPISATAGELQVFVLVHYFGFPNDTAGAQAFADANQMLLVEDAAHVLGMSPGIGAGDMLFFSPWKLLAVPSGGILIGDPASAGYPEPGTDADVGGTLGWLAVRLVQRAFRRFGIPWHGLLGFPSLRRGVESNITPGAGAGDRTGRYASQLLQVESRHAERVYQTRRRHYLALLEGIHDLRGVQPLFAELPDGVCPYMFPIVLDSSSAPVASRLQLAGIPALQWPELPEEIGVDPMLHREVLDLRDHVLLLPLHQDLNDTDLQDIVRNLRHSVVS